MLPLVSVNAGRCISIFGSKASLPPLLFLTSSVDRRNDLDWPAKLLIAANHVQSM